MNEPAFPAMHFDLADNEHGMTLRDYFAAKAMQGLIADGAVPELSGKLIAEMSFAMADAMLVERKE